MFSVRLIRAWLVERFCLKPNCYRHYLYKSKGGKKTEKKERLNKSASCIEMPFPKVFKTLLGALWGSKALFMLSEDIMFGIPAQSQ